MSTEWKIPSEQEAREAFWGCYPDTGDSAKCDLWMTAFRWCRAMLAASPQPAAQPEPTRAQKMRDAGYTRRPSWKSLPSDSMDDEPEQPEPGGLTDERIKELFCQQFGEDSWRVVGAYFREGCRAIEREVLSTTRKRTAEQNARIMDAVDRCAASSRRDEKDRLKGASEETNKLCAEVERLLRGEA